ncbi:hypothetical protein Y695_04702 [Hydrogenophaga sp. T4]|nr:hypothetical protein Y695_04702 [Hydrogenophaga sp. T4]
MPAAITMGCLIEGFNARKSFSLTSARRAMSATSMSRSSVRVSKKGWLPIGGSWALNDSGRARMFFTACSLGTYMRVSSGMSMSV